MTWAPYQQYRLAHESHVLRQEMPDFTFYDPTGMTNIRGWWRSQNNNAYLVRIDVPPGYPDECPSTYIEVPAPLLDFRGQHVTSHGTSHYFHTWETARPGQVQLCTFKPAYWNASNTMVQLIQKAFLWIIAYEEHRATGKAISQLLLTME